MLNDSRRIDGDGRPGFRFGRQFQCGERRFDGGIGCGGGKSVKDGRHFLAQKRGHQHRFRHPVFVGPETRQHTEPRVNVARWPRKFRRHSVAAQVLLHKLRRQPVKVAADQIIMRPQRRAVAGKIKHRRRHAAAIGAHHFQHLHFAVNRHIGIAPENDPGFSIALHRFPAVGADGRSAAAQADLHRGQPVQRGVDHVG